MDMAALYVKHRTPFVMGTTGGDREKLLRDTEVCCDCLQTTFTPSVLKGFASAVCQ